jgi:hypothetical protein
MRDQKLAYSEETTVREIDLGAHYLFLKSDQSIELGEHLHLPCGVPHVLTLDHSEAYRLMLSLVDLFQEVDQLRQKRRSGGGAVADWKGV